MLRDNRFIIIFCFGIIIAVSLVFHKRVSELLSFRPLYVAKTSGNRLSTIASSTQKKNTSVKSPEVKEKFKPAYIGRDPAEIRPIYEEVKLFSDTQKNKLYEEIRVNARAVQDDPTYLFGWVQIGLLKKIIGDYEGAGDAWEYAGVIRPANSVSFANLGELYWKYLPDYARSEKNFRISIKNKPDDPDVYIALSNLYFFSYKEKTRFADDVLLEGIRANPKDVNLLKSLASLYEQQADYIKAVEWWKKALEKEPDNKDIILRIETLAKKTN